jgi:hypothetical protein
MQVEIKGILSINTGFGLLLALKKCVVRGKGLGGSRNDGETLHAIPYMLLFFTVP